MDNNATDDGDTADDFAEDPVNVLCSDVTLDSIVDIKNLLLSFLVPKVDESTTNKGDTDSDPSEDSLTVLWSDGRLEVTI